MNYPNATKKDYHKNINYKNRGMNLESIINTANEYYFDNDIAIIYKKPTPIGIAKVKYGSKTTITNGYFQTKSTLDYNGLYKGKYLDFDAKETLSKTSFPLSNIHNHQINHIRKIINHGGYTFLIISMNNFYYLFKGEDLIQFIDNSSSKSIPYKYIKEHGYIINYNYLKPLDYLKVFNKVYFERKPECEERN